MRFPSTRFAVASIALCAVSFGVQASQTRSTWPPPVRKTPVKAPALSADEEMKTFANGR